MKPASLNDNDAPILCVTCDEKQGPVKRCVYPFQLSRDNLLLFWERARVYPTLFTEEIKNDFQRFLSIFLAQEGDRVNAKGLMWKVDNFTGVFYLTDIYPERDAVCHFTFFDGRIHGRDALAKAMLSYVFNKYKFRRLSAEVPMFVVPAAISFVQRVGFKREGRKRNSTPFNGEWYDTLQFGILSHEVTTWERNQPLLVVESQPE